MIWILITGCFVLAAAVAIWFSPLRSHLMQMRSALDRFTFSCRVQQFADESQPASKDQFFHIEMTGRIPTVADNVQTDVRLDIHDVTDGPTSPQQVLSTEKEFWLDDSAQFSFQKNNGIVPVKNAVLTRWVTVAQFPCHILRFAYRGRRKLQFRVTVLDSVSGEEITSASKTFEYVYCSDGYREVHGRRLEVLRACVELAAIAAEGITEFDEMKDFWTQWIDQKADGVIGSEEAGEAVATIEAKRSILAIKTAAEMVLAYGQNTDRFAAMELILQSVALGQTVPQPCFDNLLQIARELEIKKDRFLEMTQKILLASDCYIEDASQLFGLSSDMDEQSFRKRLNEEYRKWNARVTHPDEQIRRQADQILTLIAEIRSQKLHAGA